LSPDFAGLEHLMTTNPMQPQKNWQRKFCREIAWLMLCKFVALFVLWSAFFAGVHHPAITPGALDAQFLFKPPASGTRAVASEPPHD
jgi:hypothetical protein